jgi:hypothetical protein
MNREVDLSQLSVRRKAPPKPVVARSRQLWLRYVLPGLVLLGFAGVASWAARDSLLPSQPVTVVPVVTTRAEVRQEGAPLFQAAGWVEPRPTPTLVTSLAEGFVDELLVVEGQEVKKNETIIAKLNDRDARLALDAALADLRLREDEAEALIAKADIEFKYLPFQVQMAEAMEHHAGYDLEIKKNRARRCPLSHCTRLRPSTTPPRPSSTSWNRAACSWNARSRRCGACVSRSARGRTWVPIASSPGPSRRRP